jgi:diacylglycerol kinase (ATP)
LTWTYDNYFIIDGAIHPENEKMKVILIHNPDAGDHGQPSGDEILKLIRKAGHSVVYQSSKDVSWDKVLHDSADIIALAGGDGLVGNAAKRLVGRHLPIAILPVGTANNVANSLGLTNKPLQQLVGAWATARRMKFDVGVATGPWGSTCFIEGLGVGFFTNLMAETEKGSVDFDRFNASEAKITCALEVIRNRLQSYPASRLKVTLDDQNLSGEYVLLEVMNIRSIGPNLAFAPAADPSDGLLDLVLVSKSERDQISRYLSDRIEGKSSAPELIVRRSRRLQIECKGLLVHIDDDLWPEDNPPSSPIAVDIKLSSEHLEMLTPA